MRLQAVNSTILCRVSALFAILGVCAGGIGHAKTTCQNPLKPVELSRAQTVRVLAKVKGYTEGLIFSDGYLYESQGLKRQSTLRRIHPIYGNSEILQTLPPEVFAEGLAEIDHRMFQMTYKENTVFTYTVSSQREILPEKSIFHPGEAWGLTQWNGFLVKSDGSSTLRLLDPSSLTTKDRVVVRLGRHKLAKLNELETAHGLILANVFAKDWIAMINPNTGCVEGRIDVSLLRKDALSAAMREPGDNKCFKDGNCVADDFVANGIAFDPKADELYFTGKNWPFIYVFKFQY